MKALPLAVLALFVTPPILAAQTRGTISDTRMIVEKPDGTADTSFARVYSTGKKVRSEHRGGKHLDAPFGNDSTSIQIMNVSDSGMTMYFLNPVAKTYVEFNPGGMLKGAMEMMKSMGSEMKTKLDADSTAFDSLGDGGIIAGYQTIHFRARFAAHLAMTMMGESVKVATSVNMDTYVAPALKDPADSAMNGQTQDELQRTIGALMPFQGSEVMAQLANDARRIAKAGVPLRTINTISSSGMGRESSQRLATEVLKFERAVLPDSLFAVPADYKKVDPMLRFRPDTARARTSRSLHKPF